MLTQLLNSDIFSLIVSYLWIADWVAMSRTSKSFRAVLFREVVNRAIWQRLASHIYFRFSVEVTELYLDDGDYEYDAETYFQARWVHDWRMNEDRPRADYKGMAAIPGPLVSSNYSELRKEKFMNLLEATIAAYQLYLGHSRNLGYMTGPACEVYLVKHGETVESAWKAFYTYDPECSYATQAMVRLADIGVFHLPGIWYSDAPKSLRALEPEMEIRHLFE